VHQGILRKLVPCLPNCPAFLGARHIGLSHNEHKKENAILFLQKKVLACLQPAWHYVFLNTTHIAINLE
jgi:hypothetical protein